jgi:hypothetical protein
MSAPVQPERWLPVPGFPGYEVSNRGQIRSNIASSRWGAAPRILRGGHNGDGYRTLTLRAADGHRVSCYVHHLVAEAFIGPRPEDAVVRHFDGNSDNNAASNLSYGTPSENSADQVRHGTHNKASKTHCRHGHPYDAANTVRTSSGARDCGACRKRRSRAAYDRRMAAGRQEMAS